MSKPTYSLLNLGFIYQKKYDRILTPEIIYHGDLPEKNIFVFGSNVHGKHGSGSARTAFESYGAVYGNGYGIQGQSYAIATIDLTKGLKSVSLENIGEQLDTFIEWAKNHPDNFFWMTKIGTNRAGYTMEEICELFYNREFPLNVALPIEFTRKYEVENKYLVTHLPEDVLNWRKLEIEQYYLPVDRVRIITNESRAFITNKLRISPSTVIEEEKEISMSTANTYLKFTKNIENIKKLTKVRYEKRIGKITYSFDIFDNDLIILEKEIISLNAFTQAKTTIDECNMFNDIIKENVTSNPVYYNYNLAK